MGIWPYNLFFLSQIVLAEIVRQELTSQYPFSEEIILLVRGTGGGAALGGAIFI